MSDRTGGDERKPHHQSLQKHTIIFAHAGHQELLMGRKLSDKLPKVQISKDRATEAQCQLLLNSCAKLRPKKYADGTRAARFSDIKEGDQALLKQARKKKKLSPSYEPDPYKAVHKDETATILVVYVTYALPSPPPMYILPSMTLEWG
ncbi:hypothetical protein ACROYT_G001245 [Oculina patagonica]